MKLQTKHFGEIEVDEGQILTFEHGLPGFPEDTRFVLLQSAAGLAEKHPFCWLQSVTHGDNAFVLMDVFPFYPNYQPAVDEEFIMDLGDYTEDDLLVYNVVVLPEDIKKMTVNLVAPLIINKSTRKGKQVVVSNPEYGVRHYLFAEAEQE